MLKNKTPTTAIILAAIVVGFLGFIVTNTIAGISIGFLAGILVYVLQNMGSGRDTGNSFKIKLHEEQLDITKRRLKAADLRLHKETITEEKQITVPVTRENLVVEKEARGAKGRETMRIPLSEEHVEVIKHPRRLNQVNVSKKAYTVTETVEETLKKEKLTTGSKGDANIREK